MKEVVELIYTRNDFYESSGTFVSPLYKISGERYHYGFMKRDLEEGKEIHIRQATPMEIRFFKDLIERMKKENHV